MDPLSDATGWLQKVFKPSEWLPDVPGNGGLGREGTPLGATRRARG